MELLASGHLKARGWGADAYAVHANSLPIAAALSGFTWSVVTDPARRQFQEMFQSAVFTVHGGPGDLESYASNQRQAKWTSAIDVL